MKPLQTWEVQTKCHVKSSIIDSSMLRLSLRQYVEPQTDITFTFISVSFTFWNLCRLFAPAVQFPLSLSFWLNLLSEPMHVCTPAHVWTLQRLAIWSTFWLSTTFLSFSEPMQVVIAPCRPVPYGPMQRLCHPAHFFPFRCKSKLFNSKENCKSQIPDSLSCFSLWATRKRTNYTTALLSSQDPLQSSNAVNLVKLHASLLVVQDVHSTWPKVRKGNPPGSTNITSILFSDYVSTKGSAITKVGKPHWQSSLQRP